MDTKTIKNSVSSLLQWLAVVALIGGVVVIAIFFRNQWLPQTLTFLNSVGSSTEEAVELAEEDPHAGHDHGGHEGHDEGNSLELSQQARANIGLKTATIELKPFVRTISVPSIVIGNPGVAQVDVTATMGGRVTRVYPIEGEAIEPGQPLFDLRLTHEELVQSQSELLLSLEQLDVEVQEIKRLEAIVDSGVIAGKRLIERQYEKRKIEAVFNARRQSLLLHGLTEQQIDEIIRTRKLIQGITIVAPKGRYTVQRLNVNPGQYIDAGAPLCSLMNYGELYVQGRAFEEDANELVLAVRESWDIEAILGDKTQVESIKGLKILYVDNEVDPDSRALHFYLRLPNKVIYETKSPSGHRFQTWQFKPGQRMQLQVPVEQWPDRIVLPIDAVAKEGVENYVFQQNGDHFDRTTVQVEYQDQFWVVIANDGTLFPGDTVAISGANQMQMALKNKAGGAVDPHAGHNH